jgi:cytochrome c553
MARRSRRILATIILAGPCIAAAAAPPQVASCAACHGANGLGNATAGFPGLAGLPAPYIEQQLYSFKHGSRINAIMTGIATSLTSAQRTAIGQYYAALKVPLAPEPNPLPTGPGATLALNGAWNHQLTGLPSCASCHGPYGIGIGAQFPRLAGQPKQYLAAQLTDWQKHSRKNDPLHLMRTVAGKLSNTQIEAVAAYYAALAANPTALPKPGAAKGAK